MSFDAQDRRRLAWCLVVNGLPYRYYSGVAPGSGVTDGRLHDSGAVLVQTPTDVDALLDVGPLDMQLDDVAGIAAQEPVEVRIVARGARTAAGARIDPYLTFMRTAGHPAADRAVKLLSEQAGGLLAGLTHTVSGDGPVDIAVTRPVAAWTLPGPVFVGQEVIWADGYAGDGTPGNRYRFTDCTRGADGWSTQEHVVSDRDREQPWLTSDVVTWRGRKAAIYVGAIVGGVVPAWDQYWSGVLDSAPELRDDTIRMRVAPLTAVTRYKLGVGSAARTAVSVAGAHMITPGDDGCADRIDLRIDWDVTRIVVDVDSAVAGTGVVTLAPWSASLIESIGRVTELTCEVDAGPAIGAEVEVAATWSDPDLTFAAAGPFVTAVVAALAAGRCALILRGTLWESYPLDLVDPAGGAQVVKWPQQLVDVINVPQAWQTTIASWSDPPDGGLDERYGRIECRQNVGYRLVATIRAPSAPVGVESFGVGRAQAIRGGRRICWAGWAVGEGLDGVPGIPLRGVAARWFPRSGRWYVPLDPQVDAIVGGGRPGASWIVGMPVWWYQSGEPVIGPFDVDVYTGGGSAQQIRISGEGTDALVWVTGSSSAAHPVSGDTVYWYTVDPARVTRTPTVIQMEGEPALSAQVVASANNVQPGEYLLRLLMSGVGNGDNGTRDVLPIGANLPAAVLWEATFSRLPAPPALRGQDYEAVRGRSIEEQTRGLLMACGAQVLQRWSSMTSTWLVALTHMGPADSLSSVLAVDQDDMESRGNRAPVETVTDGRVVRSFVLRWNYDDDGKPVETPVLGNSERNDAGADAGEPVELDLPGVVVEGGTGSLVQAATEIVADMRARVGVPRVRWRFAIRADMPGAGAVSLGSTVTVTSTDAVAIRPGDTVADIPCRVVGLVRDLVANRLALEVRPYPALCAGWAPALLVTGITDADTVVVSAANYSADDLSYFAAGDAVACVPVGDWASRVQTTILTIVGTSVTTAAAHLLAVGDTIRLDDYDDATASRTALGGYAFLADADGLLGTADAPGRVLG